MGTRLDYLFIGDDFTGASDTLATLARAGRKVRLFLEPPPPDALEREALDAVGIATEWRALGPEAVYAQIAGLAPSIRALNPRFVHYKTCSTWDSAPRTGNIGAVVAALDAIFAPAFVGFIGGQPSLGRYCLFGNLFARGPDGQVHRIDRHPVMRQHPITPMDEADLRLHLARQGLAGLELENLVMLDGDLPALQTRMVDRLASGRRHVLFDVAEDRHLRLIGQLFHAMAAIRPLLGVGASSVAEAIHPTLPHPAQGTFALPLAAGPSLVIAGSRSSLTATQVAQAAGYRKLAIAPDELADSAALDRLATRLANILSTGANALAHLSPDADYRLDGHALSQRLAALTLAVLERQPLRLLTVAGGDTSSIIVRRLGFESLAYEAQVEPGVALCSLRARDGSPLAMRVILKGGQMGSAGLFDRLLAV